MISIREVKVNEKEIVNDIVSIHIETFEGFFLTFMGRGFLNQMYQSYCEYDESGLLVAEKDGKPIGFLAFSGDFSGLYKFMLKTRFIQFGWYSMLAFFRRPSAFLHIMGAFFKPKEAERVEKYIELSSIGVCNRIKAKGVGSLLIEKLKSLVDFEKYKYITLETDALNNDAAIYFYEKNGFVKERLFETREGRKMYEYRFSKRNCNE